MCGGLCGGRAGWAAAAAAVVGGLWLSVAGAGAESLGVEVNWPAGIPRLLHQVGAMDPLLCNDSLPDPACGADVKYFARTWLVKNRRAEGWKRHFYNPREALDFVQTYAPEYRAAYESLWEPALRETFFRFIVVLKHGGAYSDPDTLCHRAFASAVAGEDRMVVGLEHIEESFEAVRFRDVAKAARPIQILKRTFVAEAGHPTLREVCGRIAAAVIHSQEDLVAGPEARFERLAARLNGPDLAAAELFDGLFTDVVMDHVQHRALGIRVLPVHAWGLYTNHPHAHSASVLRSAASVPQELAPAAAAPPGWDPLYA